MSDQRNLILAIALSVGILLAWQYFYEAPRIEAERARQTTEETVESPPPPSPSAESAAPAAPLAESGGLGAPRVTAEGEPGEPRVEMEDGARLAVTSPHLEGSIALRGARIDDLKLVQYHETLDPRSPEIRVLSPGGAPHPYYAVFGWTGAAESDVRLPGPSTPWQADRAHLAPGSPVTLSWDNGSGVLFRIVFQIDDTYLLTVRQEVENHTGQPVTVYPYGLISRTDTPDVTGFYILHEGLLGVFNETLEEIDYDDLSEGGPVRKTSQGGWLGITDKYWLTALVPDQSAEFTGSFKHGSIDGRDRYQADYLLGARVVQAQETAVVTNRLFAGAKEVSILDAYRERYGIDRFDLAIDWGWFYFLTKPIFIVIDYFYGLTGNFGVAILLLTVLIKLAFFPLANKSYRAMSKMKKLQPEMTRLREEYKDDRMKQQEELMALYRREEVNPAAGCLPMVIQIPVFFALYKVLFVTIEMRHKPFFGWIQDLSAADPTNMFNLFGMIPWDPPSFLTVGVWPLLMGISMFLQQKLNPQPADPVQAKMFLLMPVVFTFILAPFPAGLVIYWTWNNILSMAQQWVIMRRMGVKPGQ